MNNILFSRQLSLRIACCVASWLFAANASQAHHVLPALGGDQESPMTGANMKHAGINFDGMKISIDLNESIPTPTLRKLSSHSFDPAKPWAVLTDKAYNAQHGWTVDGLWSTPAGTNIWIETVSASPELEIYQGGMYMSPMMIEMQTFDPIFGTDGSADLWKWGEVMTHNAYAVENPIEESYEATYRVFIGDSITGAEPTDMAGAPLYGSDTVTFSFATSVPEPTTSLLLLLAACSSLLTGRRS